MISKKKLAILIFLISTVFFSSYYILKNQDKTALITENLIQNKSTVTVGGKKIHVELADTAEKRMKGLSGRTKLLKNEGMLFDFGIKDSYPAFWMKDMKFSIDIVWINDNKIVGIEKNVPAEQGKSDSELTLYRPSEPIDYVLEVNAGFSEKNNIKVGDSVDLSGIQEEESNSK